MPTWTRTEEKLPDVGQRVRVAADGLPPQEGCFTTAQLQNRLDAQEVWVTEDDVLDFGQVTHWRPLS